MSLKSFFKKAVDSVARYLENQEIESLKETRTLAEQQVGYVAARGGAIKVRISPEEARERVAFCDKRLAEIAEKNQQKNQPATPQI